MTQKITTFLWFDDRAEEAMEFYTSLFADSEVVEVTRHGPGGPGPEGALFHGTFRLAGQEYMALNGGPMFRFTEAVSLFVRCDSQDEIDRLWSALTADGGEESMCGWLKDRFGLSWQIVPSRLGELLGGDDPAASRRATQAMLGMRKLDIAALEAARRG